MTAQQIGPPEDDEDTQVAHFRGPAPRDTTGDVVQFQITDHNDQPITDVLTAHRPKQAVLIRLARQIAAAEEAADDDLGVLGLLDDFMDAAFTKETLDYLWSRFDDAADELDIDHVQGPMEQLMGRWYGRPTTPRRASSPSPQRTGRRSTVRSSGKGSTRKR